MGAHRNLQMTQALAKTFLVILKAQGILLRQLLQNSFNMKKSSLCQPGVFIPMSFNTLHTTKKRKKKRNINTCVVTKPFMSNVVLPGRYARQWWHKTCGSNQPISDLKPIQQDGAHIYHCHCLGDQESDSQST